MSSPWQLTITGTFVIAGKEPDGDSVRFRADDPSLFAALRNGHRVRPSRDGTVQLRFEGIDAPELHYMGQAQQLGSEARDRLLEKMGFTEVEFRANGMMVESAQPADGVAGAILAQAVETHGRPIAWVFVGPAATELEDGQWRDLDLALLQQSLNHRMLESGAAYYTVYTSTARRDDLREAARGARDQDLGVWKLDQSGEFYLVDHDSIGPDPGAQLILPKLFRRCTDYLRAVDQGFDGGLVDWIVAVSTSPIRDEDDGVVLPDGTEVRLSNLILQMNTTVRFQPDLLDVVFIEK